MRKQNWILFRDSIYTAINDAMGRPPNDSTFCLYSKKYLEITSTQRLNNGMADVVLSRTRWSNHSLENVEANYKLIKVKSSRLSDGTADMPQVYDVLELEVIHVKLS